MVQRGYRALALWIVWAAAAIIIYFGLYQDTEVWEFVKRDPSRITWAIIGLFGLGVVTSFILTVILTLESIKLAGNPGNRQKIVCGQLFFFAAHHC